MKLTIITFSICSLILSLGCTADTNAPSTADVIESTATGEKAEDGSGTVSGGESAAPVVSSADIGDTADKTAKMDAEMEAAKMDAAKRAAMPDLPEAALTIGSKAPSLDIEHWVSNGNGAFAEVTDFDADQVYVVEFWATWCGPCVQSMPHLVELQEKFKDSVQVVSVSNEDLDTVNAFLQRPYTRGGADGPQTYGELTSSYCLTTDPDRTVGKAYMEAAGQNGIPACFVVGKTGEIEWIGHPMALDEPLSKVVDGTWDRETFAVEFKKEQAFGVMMSQIYDAGQAGDMEKAKELIEQARAIAGPRELQQLDQVAMQLKMAPIGKLMQQGDMDGAVSGLEKLIEESEGPMKEQLGMILNQIKSQLAKEKEAEAAAPADAE